MHNPLPVAFTHRILVPLWFIMILSAVPSSGEQTDLAVSDKPEKNKQSAASNQVISFLAASSTTEVMREICTQFELQTGHRVELTLGGSSSLARQILSGAEADLFLSANERWVDTIAQQPNRRGLSRIENRSNLLQNRLVVVLPTTASHKVSTLQDLLDDQIQNLALANPSVPAGIYAREVLKATGLLESLEPKIISGDNVRTTLAYVETASAQAGIVYATDTYIRPETLKTALNIPRHLHSPINYPLVLLRHGRHHPGAIELFKYLQSPGAAAIYQKHHFLINTAPQDISQALPPTDPVPSYESNSWFSSKEWAAVNRSCLVGFCVVLLSLPGGIFLGYILARIPFRAKSLVEVLVNLPLVLPPVVTGYILLLTFNSEAPVGQLLRTWFGIKIAFAWPGLVLSAAVMSFPLMVRAIRLGFQSVDPRYEIAARTLGATRTVSFFTVSLPLAKSGVIAGCVLAFARSLGEFGATVMLVSQRESLMNIPLLIYARRDEPGGLTASWGLLIVSLLLAGSALAASEYLERRGQTS